MFHPQVFKTTYCQDFHQKRGKNKCSRYYCPFAHEKSELRESSLGADEVRRCLKLCKNAPDADMMENKKDPNGAMMGEKEGKNRRGAARGGAPPPSIPGPLGAPAAPPMPIPG